jgi:arylformamidase
MITFDAEAEWPRDRIDADYTARSTCSVPEFERTIAEYLSASRAALDLRHSKPGLVFDEGTGLALDLFGHEPGALRPLVMFIHGGYWRALSKEHSAFMAPMLADRGILCAAPDYRLAPTARMTDIVTDMRRALAYLWHNAESLGIDRRRIVVTGSSAGGHLAAVLLQPGWQAGYGLPDDAVHAAMPISGLFDLAPIAASHVQDWMALSPAEVVDFSPLRHLPDRTPEIVVAVAETEAAGFHRQSRAYAEAVGAPLFVAPGRHHFDVLLDLAHADRPLAQALVRLTQG